MKNFRSVLVLLLVTLLTSSVALSASKTEWGILKDRVFGIGDDETSVLGAGDVNGIIDALSQVVTPDADGSATATVSTIWTKESANVSYSGGNVGIGIPYPTEKLEVNGNLKVSGRVNMGVSNTATGDNAITMGQHNTASGNFAIAAGGHTTASGPGSMAMGEHTTASGDRATAMGVRTNASGKDSTAMGYYTEASGDRAAATGDFTKALGDASTAMGYKTTASKEYSTAMGRNTKALGNSSTAMGNNTTASSNNSTAMGYKTTASGDYSTAIGHKTTASGNASTAMGRNAAASSNGSTIVGQYGQTADDDVLAVAWGGSWKDDDTAGAGLVFQVKRNGDTHAKGKSYSTGHHTTSDKRWKKNITPLTATLENILNLRAVKFDWRKDEFPDRKFTDDRQIGFIAQEVEAIVPELVSTDKQGYKHVDYAKLTPLLVEAVKELKSENNDLRSRLGAIEAQLNISQ